MAKEKKLKDIRLEEIKAILKSGDFDKFIGFGENQNFEVKPKLPYTLDSADEKKKLHAIAELTSDIAHLANTGEAYIVCGLTTKKLQNAPRDIVDGLDLIKKDGFYKQGKVVGILRANTHPKIEVRVTWYPYSKEKEKGLGVIHIPPQAEEKKLFIVRVCEISKGETYQKTYFGIPVRIGENKKWLDVKDVYKLTRNTPKNIREMYKGFMEQMQIVEGRLDDIEKRISYPSIKKDGLQRKIKDLLNEK